MPTLLVLHHSPTPLLREIADAVLCGARDPELAGVDVREVAALDATAEDFLTADAIIFGTPANFGYMSGALKHAFDHTYREVRGHVSKRPFSFWVHGNTDTVGARRAVESITTGLELRLAAEPLDVTGAVTDAHRAAAANLGGTLAAVLLA